MLYLTNAFSIQMLVDDAIIKFRQIPAAKAAEMVANNLWMSAVGHADTAAVVGGILGINVPMNRCSITLGSDDCLIVAQLTGGRLPEGSITIPDGMGITFWQVCQRKEA